MSCAAGTMLVMITATDVVQAVGAGLLQTAVAGRPLAVRDVALVEPDETAGNHQGYLVIGVGLVDTGQAVDLVRRCADQQVAGLVLRADLADQPEVQAAARASELSMVALQPGISWAHVVWLLRGVIDRAAAPAAPATGDMGVYGELFALADAAAAIVAAPVVVEDNQSRVLAYSSQQEQTDTARVSTIVGRRVPQEVVAHFRARGVFRRLATSSEPFFVSDPPEGTRPRLVVPARAGGEWLGSIWVVVDGPVPQHQMAELSRAASVLALHLLRLRAQADVARQVSADRLRSILRTTRSWSAPDDTAEVPLPSGPWRVVALGSDGDEPVGQLLDVWESIGRRHGWHTPSLVDLDGTAMAVVTAGDSTTPGSWRWLRELVARTHEDHTLQAAAGCVAETIADLPRSRAESVELLRLLRAGAVPSRSTQIEDAWAAVAVERAVTTLAARPVDNPLQALVEHDSSHGTAHVATLASWLRHQGEPRLAARELHVHPNTLRYRMARIAELTAVDLGSPQVRLALQLLAAAAHTTRAGTPQLPSG